MDWTNGCLKANNYSRILVETKAKPWKVSRDELSSLEATRKKLAIVLKIVTSDIRYFSKTNKLVENHEIVELKFLSYESTNDFKNIYPWK